MGAFLLVGVMLAYMTLLYAFAREQLGWWLPSASLTDPNVVASFVPWLFPLAISLQAGVVEEVVFRAIPLAGAVLLGRRFGGQRYWVAAALVLQAIVFGAVHADYPAQPAYARLVEIAIPFVFIGVIYLVFGLLPAIVMHFAFDVVMFSLPLFASSAPGVWLDRVLVVALALVPLWVVLYARWRRGPWIDLPDALRNGGWSPPAGGGGAGGGAEAPARAGRWVGARRPGWPPPASWGSCSGEPSPRSAPTLPRWASRRRARSRPPGPPWATGA